MGSNDGTSPVVQLSDLAPRDRTLRVALATLRTVAIAVAMIAGYVVLPVHDSTVLPTWLAIVVTVVSVAGASVFARWSILRSQFPMLREVQAIAFIVLLSIVGFAAIYASVTYTDDNAFSEPLDRVGALYLSVVTASTVGFGDIHARSDAARVAVMLQIATTIGLVGVAVQMIRRASARRATGDHGVG